MTLPLTGMALLRSNYGGKSPVSIKHENLHSFKEGVILLCQSILETRRISHLHGSALFTIPLKLIFHQVNKLNIKTIILTFFKILCICAQSLQV